MSSAPLDLLAGVVAQEAAALARSPRTRRGPGGIRKPRQVATPTSTGDEDADSKRALRAERNRQSAAASRDRKKQHLRELENQVRYLSEMATTLQYKSHVDMKEWREKKAAYEAENNRLAKCLAEALADNNKLRRQVQALRNTANANASSSTDGGGSGDGGGRGGGVKENNNSAMTNKTTIKTTTDNANSTDAA